MDAGLASTPRRVVVRGPNWLGDLVMAAPAIGAVHQAWPSARVDVAVPAGLAPIVSLLCPRASALPLEGGRTGVGAVLAHAEQVRAGRYDVALLLTNSFGSALAMQRAGVPERWGYRRDARGWLLTRAIAPRTATRISTHHADYYAALVAALGLPRPALEVRATVPDAAREQAVALLRDAGWDGTAPLLACAPGAAYGAAKQWPPAYVAQVVSAWAGDGGTIVIVGAGADRRASSAVRARLATPVAERVLDLTGRTSLLALAGVLATATRVLANDSGAMHVAAALGTPTVAVFGPTREFATAPLGPHRILTHEVWCRPCMLRECPLDHRCMTGVLPGQVLAALKDAGDSPNAAASP
jgi:heptosyltransferase-2